MDIVWHGAQIGSSNYPHAVLLIPATVDGVSCLVQVDTGANGAFLPAPALPTGPHTATLGAAGDTSNCGRAGTVGNAYFERGSIVIDLQHNRFAYTAQAVLRDDAAASPFNYVQHAGWDGGHVVVPLSWPGQPEQAALLDTGAALFTFVPLQKPVYDALRSGDAQSFDAAHFGSEVACETSSMTTLLRVGSYTLSSGVLGYCKLPVDIGVPLIGVVGLAGFDGQTITIDYLSSRWRLTR